MSAQRRRGLPASSRARLAGLSSRAQLGLRRFFLHQAWQDRAFGADFEDGGAATPLVDEAAGHVYLVGGSGYMPYGTPLDDVWAR